MFSLTRREFDAVSTELTRALREATPRNRLAMALPYVQIATLRDEQRLTEPQRRDRRTRPRH